MYRYRNSEIRDLAEQQARFATRSVRVRQLDNAEQLLLELGHAETHQFAEICHRITGYRPDSNGASAPISASDLAHDLRCLVEELSGTLEFPEEQAGEPVYSLEDVSERLGVSVRTIARWRTHGLPSRWYVRDGRKRLGVRHSSLEQFIARHQEVVERGRSFRQLTDQEREGVLLEARRLAHQGLGLTEVSRQVASTFGRAKETIRYTIRTFDSEHPEIAIFPATRSPMTADEKQLAYDLLQKGTRLAELCRRFRQPRRVVEAG
ncbi:MAG: helix-turn-helix domain-containing protein, partial [Planctomycetaceae bacterium]|nr:helix-turn-helix domain-containing protein [Planctomycetaceae bacterium]